jgi:hypothetical protein
MDQSQKSAVDTMYFTHEIMKHVKEPHEQIFIAVCVMVEVAVKVGLPKKSLLKLLSETIPEWPRVEAYEIASQPDFNKDAPITALN